MASIKFEHVYKTFGETNVVSDLNLDVEDGEFLVFVRSEEHTSELQSQ